MAEAAPSTLLAHTLSGRVYLSLPLCCNSPFSNQAGDPYHPAPSPLAFYQPGPISLRLGPSSPFLPEPALPIAWPVPDPGPVQTPAWLQLVAWLPCQMAGRPAAGHPAIQPGRHPASQPASRQPAAEPRQAGSQPVASQPTSQPPAPRAARRVVRYVVRYVMRY